MTGWSLAVCTATRLSACARQAAQKEYGAVGMIKLPEYLETSNREDPHDEDITTHRVPLGSFSPLLCFLLTV